MSSMSDSADPQTKTPRVLAGRYELGPVIGRGGMAVVHRGLDRTTHRDVAIKLVADDVMRERFLVEARRTAEIRHPNVVEVLDSGDDAGQAFLVMELLEGESLGDALAREGRLPAREALRVAGKILEALGASHALGLVHRDIKPANVFLKRARGGDPPQVTVLDFGVAKRVDGSTIETEPGALVGTFAYMSPEQIRGGDIDGRADLYSLGVLLFRMLGGKLPFEQDTAASLIHAHLTVEPPSLPDHAADPELGRLNQVVRRLLAKQPSARPTDARAARDALDTAFRAAEPSAIEIPSLETGPHPPAAPDSEPAPPADILAGLPEESAPAHFEIDVRPVPVSAGRLVAPVTLPPVALPHTSPYGGGSVRGPGPIAPIEKGLLDTIPTGLSKRLAAYSSLALLIAWFFFGAGWPVLLGFAGVALFGAVAYWRASAAAER